MPFYHQTAGKKVRSIQQNGFEGDTWISECPELQSVQDQKHHTDDPRDPMPADFLFEIDIPRSMVEANDNSRGVRADSWRVPGDVLNKYKCRIVTHDYEDEDEAGLEDAARMEEQNGNIKSAEKYRIAGEVLRELGLWNSM